MCSATFSCRWAWTNNERFSLTHATCLSAALGSAYTVIIGIRPVGCSLHTCTPSHNATTAWPAQATCSVPKPLLMLAGIRWRAYSQIDGSRSAADRGEEKKGWIVWYGQVAGTGCAAMSVAKFRTTFIIFGLGQREVSRQFKVQH